MSEWGGGLFFSTSKRRERGRRDGRRMFIDIGDFLFSKRGGLGCWEEGLDMFRQMLSSSVW